MSDRWQRGTGEGAFSVGSLPSLSDLWADAGVWLRAILVILCGLTIRLLTGLW